MPYDTAQQGSAVYVLTTPSGHRAVFNDQADSDYVGALGGEEAVTGLDSAEVRAAIFDRVEADGAIFGNFYHGNRPITLQAELVAATVAARNARENKLYQALNDCMRGTGILEWTPSGSIPQFVYVRKYQPARIRGAFKKDLFISLIAADPYIYSITLNTVSGVAPATDQTITNEGNAAREPGLIRVTGPTNGTLRIRNATPATQEIVLEGMPNLLAGEYIDIDPINRIVAHSSGADYYRYINYVETVWWQLQPGANTVSLRGTNTTGSLRVDWRHAWL